MDNGFADLLRTLRTQSSTPEVPSLQGTAELPPEEPTEEEKQEFLRELPDLVQQTDPPLGDPSVPLSSQDDCISLAADEIMRSLGDGTYLAPDPIDSDFVLLGPVEKFSELEAIYQTFRSKMQGVPITSITLQGAEYRLENSTSGPRLLTNEGQISYTYESTTTYEWGTPDTDVLIWVKVQGVPSGYILNGWVFTMKG